MGADVARAKKDRAKRYRVVGPADWRERHLAAGWDEQLAGRIPPFGISYPPERRALEGELVEDLPAESIGWLLADGLIEEVA